MIKVLIVEDDPMVREINEKFLSKIEGFTLYDSVCSIAGAKKSITEGKPDLVLLDIFFPEGKGIDFLKWIRAQNLKCDVILITADKNMETVKEAFRYGAVDYLIKPFVFERFKEAMMHFKGWKLSLENKHSAEQEMIDQYTINEKKTTPPKMEESIETKGFSQYTYEKVLDFIQSMENRSFTAQQVAKKIGVSRITARRYLDYLERENKIVLELEYGKVGRPLNKFRLKEE